MQAFDIHDTYINVVIPFNKDIVSQMSDGKNNGKNNGKNDGKNLFNNDLTENEKRVLLELINNPSIPYDTLVVELKISRRTVSRVFETLVKKGYIQRVGTNKKGYWKVIK
ncbi:MAG: helix-turn-helix domain-containing protein [Bacilli bacterium]|nr:helix-turn-helix domain-containing protein [Bacilli bacterium]MDY4723912.1 helix-turn-helix domain-containing protein [Bacilli bacterium]MDY4828428.1 helix-turn-helix domain-containing protein [Bacilli bacterium]